MWFTARRSSTDVAALALGLARTSSSLVDGCDARLREHLRALPAPAQNVEVLAEILGEDLAEWPATGWIVLDEYQEVARGVDAERFVAALVAAAPIRLLIASRQRPSWVGTREILYGEVLELNQVALAMDSTEAAELLSERSPRSASGLVALANGWPAVIGLASVSSAEIEGEVEEVPESLYRFFAEEIFGALGSRVQAGLTTLAVAPALDRELAGELLGPDDAEAVCDAALSVGILEERGDQLELHPLARSFLEEQSEHGLAQTEAVVARCLDHYRDRHDWDASFDLIARHGAVDGLEPLLLAALDELLDTARLSTIETWCALASESGVEAPAFSVARAEVALRHGRHAESQAYAEAAATADDSQLTFRALSVAGRAAHLASREEDALELYRRAEAEATSEAERRDALWGQLRCFIDLEQPDARPTLEQLSVGVGFSDPREVVRSVGHRLHLQLRFGSLELGDAEIARQLLPVISDPLVESSFLSVYSTALALAARYREALEAAGDLLSTAQRYRLDFAIPYGLSVRAMAGAGLRDWSLADDSIRDALQIAQRSHDDHVEQLCYAVLLRNLAQRGRHQSALAREPVELRRALPASRAEVLASRALVFAGAGRVDEALTLVDQSRGITQAVEPKVLVAAVEAICALKSRAAEAIERIVNLKEIAFSVGALDLLVVAYRSCPELLAVLLRTPDDEGLLVHLLRRVGDGDLAAALGLSVQVDDDPRERLSPREREVYELLRQGLTNLQIAKLLYISEKTVKVHAHHIYDKLGTRSRVALAVQAALERSAQATSATEGSESDRES